MNPIQFYLYGVIESNHDYQLFEQLKHMGLIVIQYEDITALAEEKAYINLNEMSKDDLAHLLIKHQKVLEDIMQTIKAPIIPIKLGSFSQNASEVRQILKKGYSLFSNTIGKLNKRVEIDIAVTWTNFEDILQQVAQNKDIEQTRSDLLSKNGNISATDQVILGKLIKDKLDEKNIITKKLITDCLSSHCETIKEHEIMNDQMIANLAFLIEESKIHDFESALNQIDKAMSGELHFKYIGPLPFYSFYTLEIIHLCHQSIEQARYTLQLPGRATSDAIKKAYLAKVKEMHPDVNPEMSTTYNFDELNKAYQLLTQYAKSVEVQSGNNVICFTQDLVKANSIIVQFKDS
ncbi:hypothetical protein EMN47_17485 [Prolixibacteraceae bacterium JC049]|nr:hypothetical protein [Prolixibacteraceae bacterium JC049]